jgi:hypothetical protein|uniref:Uncharacterized protein n=1 Tax=Siphoviridae sp. ctQtc11 TaxID=2825497 RepID=A0A8S5P393_9CAUD|nr:MAG TPA: hypothetical protein [Siphoviridae sp. ctQtc11]
MDTIFTELAIANQKEISSSVTGEVTVYAFAINMSPFSDSVIIAGNDTMLEELKELGVIDKEKTRGIILKHVNAMRKELAEHRSECTKKNIGFDIEHEFDELSKNDNFMKLFKTLIK